MVSPRCRNLYLTFSLFLALFCAIAPRTVRAQTFTLNTVHSFRVMDGHYPYFGNLIQANDGNFYGVAEEGGIYDSGTIYRITPSGTYSTLYNFCSQSYCTDGAAPIGSLTQGTDGNLYGTTFTGGAYAYGSVYKFTLSGSLTTLYSFCAQSACADGQSPYAGLVQDTDGNFYGTTELGGTLASGTVFKITPGGTFTSIYSFCSQNDCNDGGYPYSSLLQASDGNLYGATSFEGVNFEGTIFSITPSGTLNTIYSFSYSDGVAPYSAPIQGKDGNFYGTTLTGGQGQGGTLYKLTPAGILTILYAFDEGVPPFDGYEPVSGVFLASDGNFYGAAQSGGTHNVGTLYSVSPSGAFTKYYDFCSQGGEMCTDGELPYGGVLQGADGGIYGTTASGGASNSYGTVYALKSSSPLSAPVQLNLSETQVQPNSPVTLSWTVLNGYSMTLQQCYANVQGGASGAGTWTGKQTGAVTGGIYSGTATITPTAVGTYTYALTCGGQESGFVTLTVSTSAKLASTTALAVTPNPATIGQTVTLKATVTGSGATPTGKVTFSVGSTELGMATLNGSGVASLTASSNGLAVGTYPVVAAYTGDDNYDGSNSPTVNVVMNKATTTTALAASPTKVTPPGDVTLTATVARSAGTGAPTGTVTFEVGNIVLATEKVNGPGVATFKASTNGIAAGSYPVTAKYSGDASDGASTSTPVTVTVQ